MCEIPATGEPFPRGSRRGVHAAERACCEQRIPELALTCTPRPRAAALGSSVILADAPSSVCTCVKELRNTLINYGRFARSCRDSGNMQAVAVSRRSPLYVKNRRRTAYL